MKLSGATMVPWCVKMLGWYHYSQVFLRQRKVNLDYFVLLEGTQEYTLL